MIETPKNSIRASKQHCSPHLTNCKRAFYMHSVLIPFIISFPFIKKSRNPVMSPVRKSKANFTQRIYSTPTDALFVYGHLN